MFKNQEEWMRWLLDGNEVRRRNKSIYKLLDGNLYYLSPKEPVAFNNDAWRMDEKVMPKKRVLKSIWQLRKEYPYAEFNRVGDLVIRYTDTHSGVITSRKLYLFDGKTNAEGWPEKFYTEIEED